MTSFRILIAAFVVVFAFGCADVKSLSPAKVVFVTVGKEIELAHGKEVELGRIDIMAGNAGGGIRTTAQLADDAIIIKKESDVGGKYRVETRTIELNKLPVDIVEAWGVGKFRIIHAQPFDEPDRGQR